MTRASLVPTQEYGRKATWFELFFDLVFVVDLAALAAAQITLSLLLARRAQGQA